MKAILMTTICIVLALGSICNAEVIFQSRWDNPNKISWNAADDGGAWHYAYVDSGNITLARVTGDQSSLGGPTGPPPLAPNTTYYLKETWIPNGNDCQVYLQANFSTQMDLYMGMWFYLNNGFQFIDSMKFMDFRTSYQAAGNGHLALFGFTHDSYYCAKTLYSTADYTNYAEMGPGSWPATSNPMVFRYLAGPGNNVSNKEGNFNFYNQSPLFDSNMDVNQSVIPRASYVSGKVNRVIAEGGYWIAMIVHAKIHATDGEYDIWMKKGSNPLYHTMHWTRDTVWSSDNSSPHDFYTVNGTGGIDHIQINAYWNGWPSASGTRRVWISNVVVATTFEEVRNYLGISDANAPKPPTGLKIVP